MRFSNVDLQFRSCRFEILCYICNMILKPQIYSKVFHLFVAIHCCALHFRLIDNSTTALNF